MSGSRTAAQAEMLANRLRKRARHLRKWARREGVTCYRVYDRDIPEIPLVIDWYEGRLYIAYYAPAARYLDDGGGDLLDHDDDGDADAGRDDDGRDGRDYDDGRDSRDDDDSDGHPWLRALAEAARVALDARSAHIKRRQRQRGAAQYERLARTDERITVTEAGISYLVNLTDYLDTGLFLDHRLTRARVRAEAADAHVLNLFSYTGSFTVCAAAGGARSTTSVDLSGRYLDWTEANLAANDLAGPDLRETRAADGRHQLIRADARQFLAEARADRRARYDLAVLDPPSFSNSKRMDGVLDLERDHPALLAATTALLVSGGVLYFSTNRRGFRLDVEPAAIGARSIEDITAQTTPPDFERRPPHRCWRIVR